MTARVRTLTLDGGGGGHSVFGSQGPEARKEVRTAEERVLREKNVTSGPWEVLDPYIASYLLLFVFCFYQKGMFLSGIYTYILFSSFFLITRVPSHTLIHPLLLDRCGSDSVKRRSLLSLLLLCKYERQRVWSRGGQRRSVNGEAGGVKVRGWECKPSRIRALTRRRCGSLCVCREGFLHPFFLTSSSSPSLLLFTLRERKGAAAGGVRVSLLGCETCNHVTSGGPCSESILIIIFIIIIQRRREDSAGYKAMGGQITRNALYGKTEASLRSLFCSPVNSANCVYFHALPFAALSGTILPLQPILLSQLRHSCN